MNTEKINAGAERHISCIESAVSQTYKRVYIDGFKTGAQFCAENPDVIGCVTIEEAMRFAEWCEDNTNEYYRDGEHTWKKYGSDEWKTTAELFDIFKQQKP